MTTAIPVALHHTCFLVRDLEGTAQRLADALGDSFHHTCLIYSSLDDVRAAKAELQRQKRELVQEASGGDVFYFGYFRFPEIGSLVEVLYLDPARLPAPEAVIHPRARS